MLNWNSFHLFWDTLNWTSKVFFSACSKIIDACWQKMTNQKKMGSIPFDERKVIPWLHFSNFSANAFNHNRLNVVGGPKYQGHSHRRFNYDAVIQFVIWIAPFSPSNRSVNKSPDFKCRFDFQWHSLSSHLLHSLWHHLEMGLYIVLGHVRLNPFFLWLTLYQ